MGLLSSLLLIYVLTNAPDVSRKVEVRSEEAFVGVVTPTEAQTGDDALGVVRGQDRADRAQGGQLTPQEHLRRAGIYLTNRAFSEAREHYQAIIERYPVDSSVPPALYGLGRSFFQDKRYAESIPFFERVARDFPETKEGREGLYSLASAYLRMGRAAEAADNYRIYTEKYPQGERIEGAYLNVVDSLREAGQPADAINWIVKTREKFPTTATETNAVFARLRLDIAAKDWTHALETTDQLRRMAFPTGVMTNLEEVGYLRALSLERLGRKEEAFSAYLAVTDRADSYYGALATEQLMRLADPARRQLVQTRAARARAQTVSASAQYPIPYREIILREANKRRLDPRFVLSIMRQESGFRPRVKSSAAARGLLQLTMDTALKYAARAGFNNLTEDDLYRPEVNIAIACECLADLFRLFPDLPEAVAASYNGGEDNAQRWLQRSAHKDAAIFSAEVGFSETKGYVFKVISNYRAYKQLYTKDLIRQ